MAVDEAAKPPQNAGEKAFISASNLLEVISSHASAAIYNYDLAAQLGFGSLARDISKINHGAQVFDLETRAGAGLLLAGRLSGQTSIDAEQKPITAFTTPKGLAQIAPSLDLLPPPTCSNRLVIQIANVEVFEKSFEFAPSIAPIALALQALPPSIVVVASSEPKEIADVANLAYGVNDAHVIHIFDHYASGRDAQRLYVPRPAESATFAKSLALAGLDYFSYHGPPTAHTVIVITNGPLALLLKALVHSPELEESFGVLIVRVLRPWNSEALISALPRSTTSVYVVDEVPKNQFGTPYLFSEITASLLTSDAFPSLVPVSLTLGPAMLKAHMEDPTLFLHRIHPTEKHVRVPATESKKLAFWSTPSTPSAELPSLIAQTFEKSPSTLTRHNREYDALSRPSGIALDRVALSPISGTDADALPLAISLPLEAATGRADMVVIGDQALLKSHEVLRAAKPRSSVLLLSSWTVEELRANLDPNVLKHIIESKFHLYVLDVQGSSKQLGSSNSSKIETAFAYIALIRLLLGSSGSRVTVENIAQSVLPGFLAGEAPLREIIGIVWENLVAFDLKGFVTEDTPSAGGQLAAFSFNSVVRPEDPEDATSVAGPSLGTALDAAKHILFREAYKVGDESSLRPDLHEETFLVTCTVNRRLTPKTYDRNVFHLEFDTSGTGLKYAIGEALGIHGWNDENDVLDFCNWYGIDPNKVISLPVPESGGSRLHSRTVFQALQQQIDLFGRPPKSFYAALAEHATTREDRMALQFISAPEGSATFKKMGEMDTVTFADVLKHFKSARPRIEKLAELVGDIKPRHYSIASAMSAVGDRVDLLVVTVEWQTPSGSPRYGQCTRYLAELKVGQKVTVSIKPSVMKLPPDDMQPIIMAGLGTGAAPFRAFMQHRALLAASGKPAGPLVYYFGSRHRHEEYLYGEEIEAYLTSSVLTHAGLAFSRDQKKKIYIQHKMQEDAHDLVQMLQEQSGVFYLCGPTWPVPDVYATLVGAMVASGQTEESAGEYLENLKEEERYVLEVY